MKKRIILCLCAAVLMLSISMSTALAANQQYPISVETYMEGDNPRIKKVYQLSLTDDPSTIPTEDFERDGRLYYLLDMIKTDEVGVDTQTYTETVTLDSDTGELSEILKRLDAQMEMTTEDGYTGVLLLDHTSVAVEVKGYKTSTHNLSATRTYPSLSDADLSLIPKTITDGGKTLTLADVQWSGDGEMYTATASYTGTSSSKYATGYTVTANYTGQVTKTDCKVVTYTVLFGSVEMPEVEGENPGGETAGENIQDSQTGNSGWLVAAGLGGIAVLMAGMVIYNTKKGKHGE